MSVLVSLTGGSKGTFYVALGDINGDGRIDIVIGNYNQENQPLVNSGDSTFSDTPDTRPLPGCRVRIPYTFQEMSMVMATMIL